MAGVAGDPQHLEVLAGLTQKCLPLTWFSWPINEASPRSGFATVWLTRGSSTRCGNRERHFAGLLDVPISTCAAAHGVAGTHRWPLADPFLRADPVRCLQNGSALSGLLSLPEIAWEGVARYLLCVEGIQDDEPDCQTRMANG
jgi:hypothetical protein